MKCWVFLQVRAIISDFAVFITILTMVLVDYALGIPSPKLQVPNKFKVSQHHSILNSTFIKSAICHFFLMLYTLAHPG